MDLTTLDEEHTAIDPPDHPTIIEVQTQIAVMSQEDLLLCKIQSSLKPRLLHPPIPKQILHQKYHLPPLVRHHGEELSNTDKNVHSNKIIDLRIPHLDQVEGHLSLERHLVLHSLLILNLLPYRLLNQVRHHLHLIEYLQGPVHLIDQLSHHQRKNMYHLFQIWTRRYVASKPSA